MSKGSAALSGWPRRVLPAALLVAAALLLVVAALAPPPPQRYDVGGPHDGPIARGFWPPEGSSDARFRWSDGDSALQLPGQAAAATLVTLRMTAPQLVGARATELTIAGSTSLTLPVPPQWRRYQLLLPHPGERDALTLRLLGEAELVGEGERRLGVAVDSIARTGVGPLRPSAVLERWLFLAALLAPAALARHLHRLAPSLLAVGLAALAATPPVRAALIATSPPSWALAVELLAVALAAEGVLAAGALRPWQRLVAGGAGLLAGHALMQVATARIGGAALILAGAWLAASAPRAAQPGRQSRGAAGERRATIWRWGVAAALAAVLTPLTTAGLATTTTYHGDESYWVPVSARAFWLAFVERDPDDPFWEDSLYTFGSDNPQIGKYVIGAGVSLAGHHHVTLLPYNFREDFAWNRAAGLVLPPDVVGAARLPVALLAVACVILIFWLGVGLGGPRVGALAAALAVATPVFWEYARLAMIDVPALCLGLLALACGGRLLAALRAGLPTTALWCAATGAACGAAAGTKLNGLLVGAAMVAALGIVALEARRGGARPLARRALYAGAGVAACAWAVFFLSNPFLYPRPIDGTLVMLRLSAHVAATDLGGRLGDPAARLTAVWQSYGPAGALGMGGLPAGPLLLAAGGAALALTLRRRSAHERDAATLVGVWAAVAYLGVALWIPQDWSRYYLPLLPIGALLQAYGTIWLLNIAVRAVRRSRAAEPGAP